MLGHHPAACLKAWLQTNGWNPLTRQTLITVGEPISLLSKLKRLKSSLLTRLTTLLHSWIRLESSLAEDNGGYAGNTDWYKEFYNDAAFMQQHNASLSGGSEKSTYYGSVGYKGQDGLFRFGQDKYKRFNIAFNFTTQVNDWLQLNFNTKLNNSDKNVPTNNFGMGSPPYYEVYRMFPHIPIYLPNGTDFAALQGDNFNYNIAGRMALAGRTTTADKDFGTPEVLILRL